LGVTKGPKNPHIPPPPAHIRLEFNLDIISV
jgi:hypothetical protein